MTWLEVMLDGLESLRAFKRTQETLEDWFYTQEIFMEERESLVRAGLEPSEPLIAAELLCRAAARIPLSIPAGSVIAGSQDCAFSPSYALINPSFSVGQFKGYSNPAAIYDDIRPSESNGLTRERIDRVRSYWESIAYASGLKRINEKTGPETSEVVYFAEPVTGHTIPDMRPFLKNGVRFMQEKAVSSCGEYGRAMARAMDVSIILSERHRAIAIKKAGNEKDPLEKLRLERVAKVLERVPAEGARDLHEAMQSFAILWMTMALEQSPNPYAFSAGNLDRVFQPCLGDTGHDEAVAMARHLLCLFQVGRRCWAISQNVILGGKDCDGEDLTCEMTHVFLDAFYKSNDPQPALSVKVHSGTPDLLWGSLGRFFFTAGHSTPSLFNDDTLFEILRRNGVADKELPDYSIAGCQEPLVMGKSSLNTTNTWLNLAKVLELALNDGKSLISGLQIGPSWSSLGFENCAAVCRDPETAFFRMLNHFLPRMAAAGNACMTLLGREKPVPFTSALMDSFHTCRDMRNPAEPGARYHGSGCLIHGLSVAADSILAVGKAVESGLWSAEELREALQSDFKGREDLRIFLSAQDKYGNGKTEADAVAARLVLEISRRVTELKNDAGSAYLADWSTPSTHLLYGWWVGATPDGRKARSTLGYGVDPLPQNTRSELPERIASYWKLPFLSMNGGYASHLGIDPAAVHAGSPEQKAVRLADRVVKPLFLLGRSRKETPYYVYFNVDTPDHLRNVMNEPAKFAPSGVYIVRIHGTFVNFLDLSPEIQEDIIIRLGAGKK